MPTVAYRGMERLAPQAAPTRPGASPVARRMAGPPARCARRFGLVARRRAAAALPGLPRAGRRRRACARPAGRDCRSSRRPIASGSASRSPTIPGPASCRWRRSPIRRPITARAPRCATTTSRARWCTRSNTATGSISRRPWAAGWRAPGAELLSDADALVPVPLHWRRLWARRFNQSAALAQRSSRRIERRAGRARLRSSASRRRRSRSASRSRARAQRPGRVPRAGRRQGRRSPAAGWCWSTTC